MSINLAHFERQLQRPNTLRDLHRRFQSEISPVAKDVNLVLSSDSVKSTVSFNQVNNLPNISQFFLIDDLARSEWMAALVGPSRFDELANASPKD